MQKTKQTNGNGAMSGLPWTPLATGSSLVAAGIRNGTLLGGVLAAAGGALLFRALSRRAPDSADRRPSFARGLMIKRSVHVGSTPEECYKFWRNLENLSDFMDHVQSVRVVSDTRSRWVARAVGGASIEWDAEIVKDVPNQIIGWRSLPGSALQTAGSVRFTADGSGTLVVVAFKYDPPAGKVGAALVKLLGESPQKQITEELDRFKTLMEKTSGSAPGGTTNRLADPVDRAGDASFPASDPPSWTTASA